VLVPCHNEALTIASVVADFRAALPHALVYVYDNNSTDGTALIAANAGAIVRHEPLQGKGHVIRRMFADIEADLYLLVDGDGTYDAASAPLMVSTLLHDRLDMVNATRTGPGTLAHRPGHQLGNRLLSGIVATIFGDRITDLLSGYRLFSRRFVKSFPALSSGFEIETELTIHALELDMPIGQINAPYGLRPQGSSSKLNTWSDGLRVLLTILRLLKSVRPFQFFSAIGAALLTLALGLSVPIFLEYQRTHLVPRFPTAILCTGIVLLAFLSITCGLILDTVSMGIKTANRMVYLSVPFPDHAPTLQSVLTPPPVHPAE
jgi:glycosyltransferase involved in cell wall biosynthesis